MARSRDRIPKEPFADSPFWAIINANWTVLEQSALVKEWKEGAVT
jgi:hypothetical protein